MLVVFLFYVFSNKLTQQCWSCHQIILLNETVIHSESLNILQHGYSSCSDRYLCIDESACTVTALSHRRCLLYLYLYKPLNPSSPLLTGCPLILTAPSFHLVTQVDAQRWPYCCCISWVPSGVWGKYLLFISCKWRCNL